MASLAIEADLRGVLRDSSRFPPGTVSFLEAAKGGDAGIGDCLIVDPKTKWRRASLKPVELKLGRSVLKKLRPAQKRWHKELLLLGVNTYGLSLDRDAGTVLGFELELSPDWVLQEAKKFESRVVSIRYETMAPLLFE